MSHHILVAEDEADIRELLRLTLGGAGYEVECAADGRLALGKAMASRPRLVVTDLRMPTMDGLDLIRALRGSPGLSDVPVILFTAYVSTDPRVAEAKQLDGVEIVTKGPITELRRTVARLLEDQAGVA